MLVMAAFMTPMIAQIMAPVAIVIGAVIPSMMLFIGAISLLAGMPVVEATIAPLIVIIAVKMLISGNPISMFCRQLLLSVGFSAILFVLLLFMLPFETVAFISMMLSVSLLPVIIIALVSCGFIAIAIGQCRIRESQHASTEGQYRYNFSHISLQVCLSLY